jgi:anti-sigma-K factor RskA
MTTDDDRADYLAGDAVPPLDPDDQADLDFLRDLLADPSVWAKPNASLEDSIVTAIAAEASRGRGGSSISPAPERSRRAPEKDRFWRSRRVVYGAVAMAATVVLAVAISVGVATSGSHARRFSAALSATGLVTRASGTATFTSTASGWRIELRTTGLPRLDNGRYYQAWMKNSTSVLVAIGTFNQGPEVVLWSGVSPKEFPTLTVTEQEANGNPASSGRRVLTGVTTHR